jgi:hypothetical protein
MELARDDDACFISRICLPVSFQLMPRGLRVRFPPRRVQCLAVILRGADLSGIFVNTAALAE